ncbi:retrotransposon protein, putative, ty1-copia subclass [Tanacetum coccineum]
MVRSMMSQTTLPKSFWDYALESATRILNMVPTKKVGKTPYEVQHGQAPKLSYLKVWDCEELVKRDTLTKSNKLEPRSVKCILIGYPKETIGYCFYYPPENKIFVARNAEFLENSLINHEASGRDLSEPANYKAALLDPESDKWLNSMNVEMQSMKDNEVWKLVDLPPNGKTVDIRAIRVLIAITAFYDYEIWMSKLPSSMDISMKRSKRLIGLCQSAYINKVLKRFYMENSKRGTIPMQEKLKLSKSQGASTPAEIQRMQNISYASAVGSIMYVVRCTRPDVAFAQNITSRFQQNPGDMKRELRVSCYTNAGYLTDVDDIKCQTGYVFVLNGGDVY